MKRILFALVAGISLLGSSATSAREPVNLVLNWTPTADHAPIYYALEQGWYTSAGIDLAIETSKGSGMSAQRVGAGASPIGIAELSTAFVANSHGANLVGVMAIYANSPFTLYWKKSSGISGPKDFRGRTLGNPPGDAARVMWPAFAQAVGLPEGAVTFVNVAPAAGAAALAAGRVDMISGFYNGHQMKIEQFGGDLGFIRWSEVGINPYGNSFVVNGDYLRAHPDTVKSFVAVTQRAYAACVADEKSCIDALMKKVSGLERQALAGQWKRVEELMADKTTTRTALGYFEPKRVQQTYDLVRTYFKIEKPFDPAAAYTNRFLSTDIKMTPR